MMKGMPEPGGAFWRMTRTEVPATDAWAPRGITRPTALEPSTRRRGGFELSFSHASISAFFAVSTDLIAVFASDSSV